MKLVKDDVAHLLSAIEVCATGGIEDVVIEDKVIYGVNPSKTFAVISDFNIPDMGQKVGITDISKFKNVLEIFKDKDFVVETEETQRGEIRSVQIKSGRSKADFRCTSTALLKPPRRINDEPSAEITVSKNDMATLLVMTKTIGPRVITISVKSGEATFTGSSSSGNMFDLGASTEVNFIGDEDNIVFHYDPAILCSVIRSANQDYDSYKLVIGEHGTLRTKISGHFVTMLATIEGDE